MRSNDISATIDRMNTQTHRIGELGAAVIDTTEQAWDVREVHPQVLEQLAKDALAYPDVMGEYS